MADGSLIFDTKIDSAGFKAGANKMGSVAKGTMGLVTKAVAAAGTALVAFGTYAVKAGSDFEAGMSQVKAISGATAKEMDQLSSIAKKMGATTKFSATEASEALKYMAMAGWDTQKMMEGLPGVMNLAAASGEDLATVSDIVTDAMSAFGLSADKAGHFADVLAMASSKSNTNVGMMGETFKYVAPVAGALGYSIEDTAVAIGLMANAGIKASQGGTSLRQIIMGLQGGVELTGKAFGKWQVDVENADGTMRDFNDVLVDLREGFSNMTAAERAANAETIAGKVGMSGLLAIVGAGAEEFDNLTESVNNAAGASQRMADIMIDNLQGDITILKSGLEGLGIAAYTGLKSPMREVTQSVTEHVAKMANAFKSTDDIRQELLATGKSVKEVNNIINAMDLGGKTGGLQEFIGVLGKSLAEGVSAIIGKAPDFVKMGSDLIVAMIDGIMLSAPAISQNFMAILDSAVDALLDIVPLLINSGVSLVSSIATGFSEGSSSFVPKVLGLLQSVGIAIIENIPVLAKAGLNIITGIAMGLIDSLPMLIETVPRMINDFASAIYGLLPMVLVAGGKILLALGEGIIKSIPTIIANLPQIIMAIVNVFTLYNWASIGKGLILKIKDGAIGAKTAIVESIKNIGNDVVSSIKFILNGGNIRFIGLNLISFIKEGILGAKTLIIDSAKGVATSVINGFKSVFSNASLKQIGMDVVKGIANGILATKDWIWGVIKGFGDSVLGKFKDVFKIKSPSRKTRDQVGKPIAQGIAVGIESESNKVFKSIEKLSEEAMAVAVDGAEDYKDIGKLYSEYMAKGIEETTNKSVLAVTKLVNDSMATLISKTKKTKTEYTKAGKEVISAYTNAIKDGVKEVQNQITAEVEKITAEAQAQYDTIIKKKEDMESKLAGFGELFTIDQESGEAVINNLNNQIDAIQRYDDVLSNLKSKGVSDEFMSEITKLGIDEGTKFGESLLKLSDEQFRAYESNWTEKQKLAKEVAAKFYKDQLDTLQSDMVNRLDATLKSVPNIVKNVGVNAMQGMIDGMDSRKGAAVGKAKEIADAIIAELQRAMQINSPSRLTRDLIGKNIVRGIEVGIDDEKQTLLNKMRGVVEASKNEMGLLMANKTQGAGTTSVVTNNNDNGVSQTVIVNSPVKSPLEMMREAKRVAKEMAYA